MSISPSSPDLDLVQRLREHADRVAGGWPSDKNYDPETLEIEHDAADEIERLRALEEAARAAWLGWVRETDDFGALMTNLRALTGLKVLQKKE